MAATPEDYRINQHDDKAKYDSDHSKNLLNAKKSVHFDPPKGKEMNALARIAAVVALSLSARAFCLSE
jgi:hypothetical protein